MMNLSIIIALYNTEKYINTCIESIYENNVLDLSTFEVIVINDGSSDASPKIVETLQRKFSNLILINKDNGGQSTARNIGFKMARGKYIFCLDSDDWVDSKELNEALNYAIDNDLDLLPINLTKYNEEYSLIPSKKDNYTFNDRPIDGGEFLNKFIIYGSMCRYFYRKSIMDANKLLLTEGVFHEDEEFVTKFIAYSTKISYQGHNVYKQLVRKGSTTTNKDRKHRLKLLNDMLLIILNLNTFSLGFNRTSLVYKGVERKKEQLLVTLFLKIIIDKIESKETSKIINKLKDNNLFPLIFKYSKVKFKIFAYFINIRFIMNSK